MRNEQPGNEAESTAVTARSTPKDKVKVLYIAGWGRSGSTILGRVLGQVRDFFLVGELRYVWDRGLIENRLCSCGVPFLECTVWGEVASRTLGDAPITEAEALVRAREGGLRTRHLAFWPNGKVLRAKLARSDDYLEATERLYRVARDVSGGRVLVDTSKFPSYGYVLQNLPSIELYVLHLVRDPRATAYSWKARMKPRLDLKDAPGKRMTSHGYIKSSLVWNEWNLAIENVRRREPERYMLLRYEDFVNRPRISVESILRFLGEDGLRSPFRSEREILLEVPHAFSGNPDRFSSGTVSVEPDDKWTRVMGHRRQLMIAALTSPGLLRYGYPLLSQPGKPWREQAPVRNG